MKRGLAAAGCALLLGSCTPDFAKQDQSEAILRITKIVAGTLGGDATAGDNALNSDVDPVFDDPVVLTLEAIPKNPTVGLPGAFQDVTIERYEVHYIRSDGRGVEGVDVPYSISGNMDQTVNFGGTTSTITFDVVRHQAKLEPPLLNLRGNGVILDPTGTPVEGGGALILTVFADITIHGRTTTGAALTANGRLQINFANFVKATPPPSPAP
jgi:hypothetical protein